MTRAPIPDRRFDRSLACWRVRVTTTVWPKRGRDSNQLSFSRKPTTRPTIVRAGGASFASATRCGRSEMVPTAVRCRGVVPQRIDAAGMSGGMPCSISFWQIRGSDFTPM